MELNNTIKENNEIQKPTISNENIQKLSFLDLIIPYKPYEYRLKRYKQRRIAVERLGHEPNDQIKFNSSMQFSTVERDTTPVVSRSVGVRRHLRQKRFEREMCEIYGIEKSEHQGIQEIPVEPPFDYIDWEKQIDPENQNGNLLSKAELKEKVMANEFVENVMNEDIWEDQIFYDETSLPRIKSHLVLHINDPNLIFEDYEPKNPKVRKKEIFNGEKPLKSKYNLSNDKYYFTEATTKSNLGTLGVQHSAPALNLHPLVYKTFLTKDELRNFHRPKINFPQGIKISFASPEKDKQINVLKSLTDLSLRFNCDFTLFEYSEEYPPLLSNTGMVSLLSSFYRKTSFRDDTNAMHREQLTVLDVEDQSPFMGFGEVQPGQTVDALTNNLFKAPVFPHTVDLFLCVFVKGDNGIKGYLRKINSMYVVGQTLPLEEVFSPHSRKFNVYCKNRLKIEAYKLFRKKSAEKKGSKREMLQISDLDELFPYFSEGSKRKWLKEYADYVKKGKENVWVLKETASLVSDEDLRKLVIPENVCQYESMLAAEQRLRDSGYEFDNSEDEEGEMGLAPWCLTRNFVNASNGRGILELKGPGDPTGIGEGFSFVRVRQKKGEENRKFTNEAMNQYKEEINNIWNRQKESLSSSRTITFEHLPDEKEENESSDSEGYIIIKRYFNRNGRQEVEEEKVTDQRIVDLYLKSRKKFNREEKRTFLKCGSCGQPGHMKTNKICPNFSGISKTNKRRIENEKKLARNFLTDLILTTIQSISALNYSAAFLRPVSTKKFPDYPKIITNPIDLGTIKSKEKQHKYHHFQLFIDDMILMKENCSKFNGIDHSLTKVAEEMLVVAEEVFKERSEEIKEAETILND